jgi:hypothetical protein
LGLQRGGVPYMDKRHTEGQICETILAEYLLRQDMYVFKYLYSTARSPNVRRGHGGTVPSPDASFPAFPTSNPTNAYQIMSESVITSMVNRVVMCSTTIIERNNYERLRHDLRQWRDD